MCIMVCYFKTHFYFCHILIEELDLSTLIQNTESSTKYAELLQEIEPSMFNLSAVSMLLKYLTKTKDQDSLSKFKVVFPLS